MGGRKAPSVWRCLLRPLHRPARRERQRCCQRSLRRECSMSGRFADAVRWRQIAGRRQREQLAAREWPVLALHSRLLGGEPHPRWSVETAVRQASTIGQLTKACATWFRDANEVDISNVGCWHEPDPPGRSGDVRSSGQTGSSHHTVRTTLLTSRPEGFHLQALPEPYVNLSIHTAPDVRPLPWHSGQWTKSAGFARRSRSNQSLAPLVQWTIRLYLRRAHRMT